MPQEVQAFSAIFCPRASSRIVDASGQRAGRIGHVEAAKGGRREVAQAAGVKAAADRLWSCRLASR